MKTNQVARSDQAAAGHAFPEHTVIGRPHDRHMQPPRLLAPDEFVRELTAMVIGTPEANISPFYDAFLAKSLSLQATQEWVKQWYYDARCFPSVIAQIAANAAYAQETRQLMGANFAEELGDFNPQREHPMLVKKLARALGVPDEEIEYAEPFPETLLYVEYRAHLVRESHWLEGLAAGSFVIELTIPGRFRRIARCLQEQFGLDDAALEIFRIHVGDATLPQNYGGDVQHAMEAGNLIKKYATTAHTQERIRAAVWRSIEARKVYQWGLYRGIILQLQQRTAPSFRTTPNTGITSGKDADVTLASTS